MRQIGRKLDAKTSEVWYSLRKKRKKVFSCNHYLFSKRKKSRNIDLSNSMYIFSRRNEIKRKGNWARNCIIVKTYYGKGKLCLMILKKGPQNECFYFHIFVLQKLNDKMKTFFLAIEVSLLRENSRVFFSLSDATKT